MSKGKVVEESVNKLSCIPVNDVKDIPKGYMVALTEMLLELPYGVNYVFCSNKMSEWEKFKSEVVEFGQSQDARKYGFECVQITDGLIVKFAPVMLSEILPKIAGHYKVSWDLNAVTYKDDIKAVRDSERYRLQQFLLSNIRVKGCKGQKTRRKEACMSFGLYARGGVNQTVTLDDANYPIYKLTVQDLLVVLHELRQVFPNITVHLLHPSKNSLDYTPTLLQYARVLKNRDLTPADKQRALNSLSKVLHGGGVSTFSGNALMYTLVIA